MLINFLFVEKKKKKKIRRVPMHITREVDGLINEMKEKGVIE